MTDKKLDVFDPTIVESVIADTADLTMKHPVSGEPTTWVITFAGPSHPQSVSLSDRLMRQALHRQQTMDRARANGKKYSPAEKEPEEVRREGVEIIVEQIVGWSGSAVAFSREAAVKMFCNRKYDAYVKQINDFLENERVFIKDSAKT